MKISYRIAIFLAGMLLFMNDASAMAKRSLASALRTAVYSTANGSTDSLSSVLKHKATVFIFFSSECPISNSYMPLLTRLSAEFAPSDIRFFGVIADPDVTKEQAKKFATDYAFPCDILMDSKQELAALLKAHITPEVVVISGAGEIKYQGRIDDRYVALGKGRVKAQHNDLHDALTSISKDKKVKNPKTKVIGCWIPKLSN
ncbi:MAG: redoxin domain-containing protein [Bacteroidota bacterium]|nr:redoxin domain-containing protein [Bacteroidota bacterium]